RCGEGLGGFRRGRRVRRRCRPGAARWWVGALASIRHFQTLKVRRGRLAEKCEDQCPHRLFALR
ncbi:MAG: hypothetical protein ACK8QZ_10320, partial [Anaerolineales bacterium]